MPAPVGKGAYGRAKAGDLVRSGIVVLSKNIGIIVNAGFGRREQLEPAQRYWNGIKVRTRVLQNRLGAHGSVFGLSGGVERYRAVGAWPSAKQSFRTIGFRRFRHPGYKNKRPHNCET